MRKLTFYLVFCGLGLSVSCQGPAETNAVQDAAAKSPEQISEAQRKMNEGIPLEKISLPDGFRIDVFAKVNNARSLCVSPAGTVFVGNRSGDKVYAVRDTDGDGVGETVNVIAENLSMPCGVAYRDGSLYVAEVSRILRFDSIDNQLDKPPVPVTVYDKFPSESHHGWKFIAFGPDGKLYVPVGAPCNVCEREEEIYASISRMNPDGSGLEIVARGVRNSVGFDWHPSTGKLWFTDNGRDRMGDDMPADELNRLSETGRHFGFPYCHQGDTLDPEFGKGRSCDEFEPPALKFGAHTAALGMRFYRGTAFPEEYRGQIFVAQHGSWNRSKKSGYRIMAVREEAGQVKKNEVFAEGWLQNEKAWGRPADVLEMPDGSLLISDDFGGLIYRIRYTGK